jgi:hypothetical protein
LGDKKPKINYLLSKQLKEMENILSKVPLNEALTSIKKTKRFLEVDLREENEKDESNCYLPALEPLEIVECEFTGIGFEFDKFHYAVVWEVNPRFDSIVILPMTSVEKDEYADEFYVGKIKGLKDVESRLLVSSLDKSSRKRLKKISYTVDEKEYNPKLSNTYYEKILNGIAVKIMKHRTLEDYLIFDFPSLAPSNISSYGKQRFDAVSDVSYDESEGILHYHTWNGTKKSLDVIPPKEEIKPFVRQKMLQSLYSRDASKKKMAEKKYKSFYT